MKAFAIEIRDHSTCIPALIICFTPQHARRRPAICPCGLGA